MLNIIAIDTSTAACSVALSFNGGRFDQYQLAARKHAELLLPMVDSVLKQAQAGLSDLDAVACCVGPGSFTGLRIGISAAQGLAYAAQLPCIEVSSLQILAAQAFSQTSADYCLASIDARMQQVYFAGFKKNQQGQTEEIYPAEVITASHIQLPPSLTTSVQHANRLEKTTKVSKVAKVGNGWSEYQYLPEITDLGSPIVTIQYPNAKMMIDIASNAYQNKKLLQPAFLQPLYLRNEVAKKQSQQI